MKPADCAGRGVEFPTGDGGAPNLRDGLYDLVLGLHG